MEANEFNAACQIRFKSKSSAYIKRLHNDENNVYKREQEIIL